MRQRSYFSQDLWHFLISHDEVYFSSIDKLIFHTWSLSSIFNLSWTCLIEGRCHFAAFDFNF